MGGDGTALFNNNGGLVRKTGGGGTAELNVHFESRLGRQESASGTFRLSGGGQGNGLFQAEDDATLEFASDYNLQVGAVLEGSGLVRIVGGTVKTEGPVLVLNLTVAGGSLEVGAPLTATHLELDGGGTIKGLGDVFVAGTFDWTGGTMAGAGGSTRILPAAQLNITGDVRLDGRGLTNVGVTTWYGGTITLANGAGILNTLTGDFDVQTDSELVGSGSFVNDFAGRFQKSAGDGTTDIRIPFWNQVPSPGVGRDPTLGLIQARHGTLNFHHNLLKNGIILYQGGSIDF
jgi:hypothetical protein